MKTIGDGTDTFIWVDKWVFDDVPRRPVNKEPMIELTLRVAHLINDQGEWDLFLLNKLFPPCDVARICSYPPAHNLKDRPVWAYTNDGVYTVKSGNWLINREADILGGVPDNALDANKTKEKIWKLTTAPKIRLFLWRAMSGALAVAACLRNHGLNVNSECQLCKEAEETVTHVLFGCTLATQTWTSTTLPFPSQGFSNSIGENIDHMLQLMERRDIPIHLRQAIPWLLWGIWKARNSALYAGKANEVHILIAEALEESNEWIKQQSIQDTCSGLPSKSHIHVRHRWSLPGFGKLKCNLHASWVRESYYCGGAWLLRDHVGNVGFHARDAFLPMVNRIAAELQCVLWCLRSLHDLHNNSCEIWSDCGAVLTAIEKPTEWPKYRSQLSKILQVIQVMGEVSFHLSSPKANSLARDIACSVTKEGRFTSYLSMGGPAWLHTRIEEERRLG